MNRLESVVRDFPQILNRAMADYAKFKVGVEYNLFSSSQRREIADWFGEFPDLWDKIKPNYTITTTGTISAHKDAVYKAAEIFTSKLKSNTPLLGGAVLIAVGVVLFAGTVAGIIWAIGYVKEQNNISKMIDAVVAGQIPASVLKEAVDKQDASVFGDVGSILKYGAVAAGLVVAWPLLGKLVKRISA